MRTVSLKFMNIVSGDHGVMTSWGSPRIPGLNPTYASFMTDGPLHLRLGADLVDSAHRTACHQLGSDANEAMRTRGGYPQPWFPTHLKS